MAPAGVDKPLTGHHHLLIDTEMVPLDQPIPSDYNHIHLGGGQTEVVLTLPRERTLAAAARRPSALAASAARHVEEDHDLCALVGQRYPHARPGRAGSPMLSVRLVAVALLMSLMAIARPSARARPSNRRVALVIGNGAYPQSPIAIGRRRCAGVADVSQRRRLRRCPG